MKNIFYELLHMLVKLIHRKKSFPNDPKELGIKLDKDWWKNFLSKQKYYKIKIYKEKLGNIKGRSFTERDLIKRKNLKEFRMDQTPEYKMIQGDIKGYKEYRDLVNKVLKKKVPHNTNRFQKLINDFNAGKFDNDYVIALNYRNGIMDGKHRAALMFNKYGKDHKVKVIKIWYDGQ